ncbi:hypothetical protein DHEL01_v202178 [Diaporthe helianthi]|uniref:Uncharacterized protein n=1 Tax=Diaporthe helianthi TaxID=158607 RepID=A0A2P5IA86_DIAHE|nr:hypothetical protein DHEL01_v202178 [Diaporthe helianthi]
MAVSKTNDVEAFGAGLAQDIQEKHYLRETETHQQAVPDTGRPRRPTMDSGRKLLLALLVCCMVALGFASAHHGRAGCHEDPANADYPAVNVEHSSLSSLLASNSAESLRELLEKYVPERYRHEDSEIAKRQEGNGTVSAAVTTAVTTVSSESTVATTTVQIQPSPTTTAAPTPTSANVETTVQTETLVQTSVQTQDPATQTVTAPQNPTPSEPAASSGTSEVISPSAPAPVSPAPTPTSSSSSSSSSEQRSDAVDSSTTTATSASQSAPSSSLASTSESSPATPSSSSSSSSSSSTSSSSTGESSSAEESTIVSSTTLTVTAPAQETSTTLDTSITTPPADSPTSTSRSTVSSKKVTTTFTSTMPDGGISVVTQTSFSYVDAEPTDASHTRPAASLQTNAASAVGPSLPSAATLLAGLWLFLWQ